LLQRRECPLCANRVILHRRKAAALSLSRLPLDRLCFEIFGQVRHGPRSALKANGLKQSAQVARRSLVQIELRRPRRARPEASRALVSMLCIAATTLWMKSANAA